MKNKNLWLSFIIAVGVIFLLTWVVPSTNYNDAGVLALGAINPTGIWDFFYYASMLLLWFGQNVLFIVFLGIFYGILNGTGALRVLVNKIATYFKKREKLFLVLCSSLFIIISSFIGIDFPLLIFMPLVVGIILTLGFDKITALKTIIIPILIGSMGSLYSSKFYGPLAGYIEPGITHGWYKLAIIVIGLIGMGLYLYFTSKVLKGKAKETINEEMLFIEKDEGPKKQKIWPLVTILSVILVLYILGLTPWASMFKFLGFETFHKSLLDFKIGNFAIFKSIFGFTTVAFGTWSITSINTLLVILSVVLILIYKVEWKKAYENAFEGIKKLLPTAVLVTLSSIIFVMVSQTDILNTILKMTVDLAKGLNVFTYSIASFLGAALANSDFITTYVTGTLSSILGENANLQLLIFIQQVMYGIAMLIAPTSIVLLTGLSYLEVDYTKWLKNIWKLVLVLVAISIIILTIAIRL